MIMAKSTIREAASLSKQERTKVYVSSQRRQAAAEIGDYETPWDQNLFLAGCFVYASVTVAVHDNFIGYLLNSFLPRLVFITTHASDDSPDALML